MSKPLFSVPQSRNSNLLNVDWVFKVVVLFIQSWKFLNNTSTDGSGLFHISLCYSSSCIHTTITHRMPATLFKTAFTLNLCASEMAINIITKMCFSHLKVLTSNLIFFWPAENSNVCACDWWNFCHSSYYSWIRWTSRCLTNTLEPFRFCIES